jgi:hypothetical protein
VQVSLLHPGLHSLGCIPRRGIVGSCDSSDFSFLRSRHTASHQHWMKVPSPPQPRQHLLSFLFLMVAIATGVRWNLSMVLICISFMTRDGEHFFMCFWPFKLLPLKKLCWVHLPISSLGHWLLGSLVLWTPCIFWLWIPCQTYSS